MIRNALALHDEEDVNVLYRWALDRMRDKPESVPELFRAMLDNMRHEKEWIRAAKMDMADEMTRVARIGETMKRAGLRSYTDKDGRIYVAGDQLTPRVPRVRGEHER